MVREDILGGLRTALARGQTLRQAMMSFYNAGYVKEEIEEAARTLQAEKNQPLQPQFVPGLITPIFQRTSPMESNSSEKPKEVLSQTAKLPQPIQSAKPQTIQIVSAYGLPAQPIQQPAQAQPIQQPVQTIQRVSAYGPPIQPIQPIQAQPQRIQQPLVGKPRGKTIIFILLALLIILVGGLIAVFFFKEEIISLFG